MARPKKDGVRIWKRFDGIYEAILRTPAGDRPVSLKTRNFEEAKRKVREANLEELQRQALTGIIAADASSRVANGSRVTVAQALDDYLAGMAMMGRREGTIRTTSLILGQWIAEMELEQVKLVDIEAKHIDRWVNAQAKKRELKVTTRARMLTAVNTFFTFCVANGWVGRNPAGSVGVNPDGVPQEQQLSDETHPLTFPEIQTIMNKVEPDTFWWFAVQLSWYTGMRLGDIVNLQWTNIRGNRIVVMTSKGMVLVDHTMGPELARIVSRIPKTDATYCFPMEARRHAASPTYMSQQFRRTCIKLGIEGKSFHGIRHAYALRKKQAEQAMITQRMIEEMAMRNTQAAMGHSAQSSTEIYLKHPIV